MRTKLLSWMLLCGVALLMAVTAQAQQGKVAGRIVAAKVRGTVTAFNTVDNSKRELRDNDAITEKYVVTTAQNSSVILVFSNGSTINLAQDSTLSIEQFLQDPFSTSYSMATASEEPTTSVTKLTLARGELVGNVKHLHQDGPDASSFTVNTPVGAAGIRGTTFRIVFRPDSSGKAFFSLSTAEGEVVLTGSTTNNTNVPTGQEVVVTVDVKSNPDGTFTVVTAPQFATENIPPATQAAIADAVQAILASHADLIFTSQNTSTTTPPAKTEEKAPDAQPQKDQTTPKDGKPIDG